MEDAPTISTHVLDTEHGEPAQGIEVRLFRMVGPGAELVGSGTTDPDGRIRRLLPTPLTAGGYQLEFNVQGPFFQVVALTIEIIDPSRSYHVPLLLAPYSLASYRGS